MNPLCPYCKSTRFESCDVDVAPYALTGVKCASCNSLIGVTQHPDITEMIMELYRRMK